MQGTHFPSHRLNDQLQTCEKDSKAAAQAKAQAKAEIAALILKFDEELQYARTAAPYVVYRSEAIPKG